MQEHSDNEITRYRVTIDQEATRRKYLQFVIEDQEKVIFTSFMVSQALEFLEQQGIQKAELVCARSTWQLIFTSTNPPEE